MKLANNQPIWPICIPNYNIWTMSLLRNIKMIAIQYINMITTLWYCLFIPNPQKSYSWFKAQNTYHITSFCMYIYNYIYIHISNRMNNNPPQRSPETNIIQQISSQSSQSSTNTNRLIQQKPRSLANQHNPTKSNSHK